MNNIHNLTIVIVTYRTDEKILKDCLNSIDPQVNILLVENSKDIAVKEKIENSYPNVSDWAFGPDYILPKPTDPRLFEKVSTAVAKAAIASGVNRLNAQGEFIKELVTDE